MTVIKRDMPKKDKAAMVKLLLYFEADIFAEDNVSAGRVCMYRFSSLAKNMN